MSLVGKIQSLFLDREKTQPIFPITKVKAVSDDNGKGLNVLLDDKASKDFVTAKIAEAQLGGGGGEIDLSGFATKDDLNAVNDKIPTTPEQIGAHPNTWMPTAADVGAAPAGYGLGEDAPSITLSDCNDATKSGWYRTSGGTANQPLARANWMRVDAYSSTYLCQTWFNDQYDGCTATRFKIGGNKWTPWEWVNPPMAVGQEYRTTERFNGHPVYTKLIYLGNMPVKDFAIWVNHECGTISPIRISGHMATYTLPFTTTSDKMDISVTADTILVKHSGSTDWSGYTGEAQIWYIKE